MNRDYRPSVCNLLSLAMTVTLAAPACGRRQRAEAPAPAQGEPAGLPTSVTMSPEAILAAGVKSAPVMRSKIVERAELPGTIESPRDATAIANTPAGGVVESLLFDVGDRVKVKQRLATVRSIELAEAQAAYRRAQVAYKYASAALERSETLLTQGVIPVRRVEADRLAAQEQRLALQEAAERVRILGGSPGGVGGILTVTTPIAGAIASRSVNNGQAVEANDPLFTIVDVSRVVVQLRALGGTRAEPGTEVPFTVEALPGRSFTAVVKSASDVLDPETRRFLIRCSVDNADGALKPGMFVSGQLATRTVDRLTVPANALQIMPEGPTVFVAQVGGRFERRSVVLGLRADGQVAVEKGLSEGESVVVEGSFWVRTQLQKSELEE